MVFFTGPARLIRGHGAAGAGLGEVPAAYEEALRARSHGAHCEIRTQAEREAPTGSPDGPRPGTGKA
ncbi:hypothetical protein [Streptomyces brasiliensis]|nr:hypothetical protein [Streptomyces brasiliensis]